MHRLRQHLVSFEQDNETNLISIEASFRLDADFRSYQNVALLIEMDCEFYIKAHNSQVVIFLKNNIEAQTR